MSTVDLVQFDADDIEFEERIGKGRASVFKATIDGKMMAVKEMDCGKNEIPQEIKVHGSLPPHPNVLKLYGVAHTIDGFTIYICLELADTSLHHYLHTEKKKPSLEQSTKWALQIARGMYHIHEHGLAHRDLKSANVLLFDEGNTAKVCDFGSTRPLEHTMIATGMKGTHRWMAPEFYSKGSTQVNQRCDVFSYGMVLYEIFAHEIPFSDIDQGVDVLPLIREGQRPPIPADLPLYIRRLMESCWEPDPHDRPTFEVVLEVLTSTPMSEEETQEALSGWTSLHRAALSGDTDTVQALLDDHVNINAQNTNDATALFLASRRGHVGVVQALTVAHADINLQNQSGETPLYTASYNGHTEVVDILIRNGADPNLAVKVFPYSVPLGAAAQNGYSKIVEELLEGGAIVNHQDEDGLCALYYGCRGDHIEVVDTLLRSGADPNLLTREHLYLTTPLRVAAEDGFLQVVEKLLKGGANPNAQDKFGETPLYWASYYGHVEVVRVLLKEQADVNICNIDGFGPLYVASMKGHTTIVDTLLKKGADPNKACTVYQTVCMSTAFRDSRVDPFPLDVYLT